MLHVYIWIFDVMGTVRNFLETKEGPNVFLAADIRHDLLGCVIVNST